MLVGDNLRGVLFITIPLVGHADVAVRRHRAGRGVALFWMPAKDATVPNLVPRNRLEAANQLSLVSTYGSAPLAADVQPG